MSCAFQFEKYYESHSYSQTLLSPSWCDREKNLFKDSRELKRLHFYTCIYS